MDFKFKTNLQSSMKVLQYLLKCSLLRSQVTEVYTTVDPRENVGYIINGGEASPGERKEIVSIQNFKNEHICGGVIVGNEYILSAAHCLDK